MKKVIAKPFLKWAGGKTQLIEQIENQLPKNIFESSFTYIEPFVGSGAVLFWMLEQFPNMENAVINDINTDLTNCYISIKEDVEKLINTLSNWQTEFYLLSH
ncbi:DNA adenine methylase, partial [Seonamhaeicola marinus]